jgi:hypothetical protein
MTYDPALRRARIGAVVATFVAICVSLHTGGGDASPGAIGHYVDFVYPSRFDGGTSVFKGISFFPDCR